MNFTPKLQIDDPAIERMIGAGWCDENNKETSSLAPHDDCIFYQRGYFGYILLA